MPIRRGIIAAVLGCIVVASCLKRPPTALPPAEVMRRAVFTNQTVDSVSFDATALFRLERQPATFSGSVSVSGVLHAIEQTWSAEMEFDVADMADESDRRAHGTLLLSSPSPGSVSVLPRSIESSVPSFNAAVQATIGQWWILAGGTGAVRVRNVRTPDPHLVEVYARIVNVTGGGLERELGGRYVYHYTVRLGSGEVIKLAGASPDGVIDATGEVWINPDSFVLERARWTIRRLPVADAILYCDLDIRLKDINTAPEAILPDGSGTLFPLDTILDIISVR